ncbi:MAG: class II aldolase/adducin family protein [Clostridia bacterium]|nr:class II aldolase/adducin family protein [Clostridia bacterium]
MLDTLKEELFSAIIYLKEQKMRLLGKGNLSLLDRKNNLIVAEPAELAVVTDASSMLVTDMAGNVVEGDGAPNVDLPAHIALYRAFPQISSVAHTHSIYAAAWAQAGRDIPVYGTGHIDFFEEAIPCSREITPQEAETDYDSAAGLVIAEAFEKRSLNPESVPGALLFQHGAFSWGSSPMEAASRGVALEQIAMLAYLTEKINPDVVGTKRNVHKRNF